MEEVEKGVHVGYVVAHFPDVHCGLGVGCVELDDGASGVQGCRVGGAWLEGAAPVSLN